MSIRANNASALVNHSKTAETFNPLKNGYTTFYMNDLEALKLNIEKQNNEIINLTRDIEGMRSKNGQHNNPGM